MRRLAALLVLVTACADGSGAVVTTSVGPSESSTTVSAGSEPISTSTTSPGAAETDHDRELAPDFTLALADGGVYTLSQEAKPVYLVFWAEWCPVCRRELPVVDRIAAEYVDRVDFIAPVWKSDEDAATEAAATLFPSGQIRWGMDSEEVIFGLYGVPYQPVTVLIAADQTVVEAWPGVRSEELIRQSLDDLLSLSS